MTLFQTALIALPMLSHTGLMMLLYSHLKIGPSTSRTKLRTALNTGLTVVFHHVLMIAPMSRKIAWNVFLSQVIVGDRTFFQNEISALKMTLTPAHQVLMSTPMKLNTGLNTEFHSHIRVGASTFFHSAIMKPNTGLMTEDHSHDARAPMKPNTGLMIEVHSHDSAVPSAAMTVFHTGRA